jgi:hypothetical protein
MSSEHSDFQLYRLENAVKGKPQLHQSVAEAILRTIFGLKAAEMRELPSYYDRNFYVRVVDDVSDDRRSYHDGHLTSEFATGNEYVLKVYNTVCTDYKHLGILSLPHA